MRAPEHSFTIDGPLVVPSRYQFLNWLLFRATFHSAKKQWRFTPHEEAFADGESKLASERLVKFTLPSTERAKALKFLDAFNLNAYSLFGSEESLMETIALREFELK